MISPDDLPLLVPMRVDALAVGTAFPDSSMFQWTELAPKWERLDKDMGFKFGPELVSNPFDGAEPLPAGVHLHFRLPPLFTRAHQEGGGKHTFLPFPNRWLVQRICRSPKGGRLGHRAWLVCSDAEKQPNDKGPFVAWPDFPSRTGEQTFKTRRLGTVEELSGSLPAGPEPMTVGMTAVGRGDLTFAAHYLACRAALGFHDDMVGIEFESEISYLVAGFFSHRDADPLARLVQGDDASERLGEWAKDYRLDLPEMHDGAAPNRILCHGLLDKLRWSGPDVNYMRRSDSVPGTGGAFPGRAKELFEEHEVAFAGTGGEALAALVVRQLFDFSHAPAGATGAAEENLLAGLYEGLIDQQQTIAGLRVELHARGFEGVDGGKRFEVAPAASPVGNLPNTADEMAAARQPEMPASLRAKLDELSAAQSACDAWDRTVADRRRQLYSLWCQLTQHRRSPDGSPRPVRDFIKRIWNPDPARADPRPMLEVELENLAGAVRARDEILAWNAEIERASGTLVEEILRWPKKAGNGSIELDEDGQHKTAYELTRSTAPPFFRPTDPAVAIRGPAMQRRNTGAAPERIACRTADMVLRLKDGAGLADLLDEVSGEFEPLFRDLLEEALLLSELTGTPEASKEAGNHEAVSRWRGNPWNPLFVAWKATWEAEIAAGPEDRLSGYDTGLWKVDPSGDIVSAAPKEARATRSITGHALLTTSAEKFLVGQLEHLDKNHPLREPLAHVHLGLQRLVGFNDSLSMQVRAPQVPPADYVRWAKYGEFFLDPIADALDIGGTTYSSTPDFDAKDFMPVRAGRLRLEELLVIDAFGQTMKLPIGELLKGQREPPRFRIARAYARDEEPNRIVLSPRLVQPARLRFEGQGVAGWVLPNHLEKNLLLYTASGRPILALQKRLGLAGRSAFFEVPVPRDATLPDAPAEPTEAEIDPEVARFRDWVLGLPPDEGTRFFDLIGEAVASADQRVPEQDAAASLLVGRPFALVRARLGIEFAGLPATRPDLPRAGELETTPPAPGPSHEPENAPPLLDTHGFEQLTWPVRLGDRRARNDGLVGFFADGVPGDALLYHSWDPEAANDLSAELRIGCTPGAMLGVTLLMDPQARVHATTGVLPRAFLQLGADEAAEAQQVREVFFQTAPVIGHSAVPAMPRPSDDYGEWSWAHRPGVTGAETLGDTMRVDGLTEAPVRAGAIDRQPMIAEGWLRLALGIRILSFRAEPSDSRPGEFKLAWSVHGAEQVRLLRDPGTEAATPIRGTDGDHKLEEAGFPITIDRPAVLRLRAIVGGTEVSRDLRIG